MPPCPLTHISTLGPSYSFPSNNSGAAYGGLPHHVLSREPHSKWLLKPKSAMTQVKMLGFCNKLELPYTGNARQLDLHYSICVPERSGSVLECQTFNRGSPGSNPFAAISMRLVWAFSYSQ